MTFVSTVRSDIFIQEDGQEVVVDDFLENVFYETQ